MARHLLEQKYRKIFLTIDLHYLNPSKNSDKVYHLAVLKRDDGKFDAVYRYGRRGKKLQEGMIAGGFANHSHAISAIRGKEIEQLDQGYVDAPGITPKVWNDLLLLTPPPGWTDTPTTGPDMWGPLPHGRRVLMIEMGKGKEWYTVQVFEDGTIAQQSIGGAGGIPPDIVRHATLQGALEDIKAKAEEMAKELRSDSFKMVVCNIEPDPDPVVTEQPTVTTTIPPAPYAPSNWFW